MVVILDFDELRHLFKDFNPLSQHIDLSELIHILLINNDECDRYQKAVIWQAIESSEVFNNDDFMSFLTDDYLTSLDIMIEMFSESLYNYISFKLNSDVLNKEVKYVNINNTSLIVIFDN